MRHIFRIFLIATLLVTAGSCGNSTSSRYRNYQKKRASSYTSTTQLGRNKMFFSKSYQTKLKKSYKRKK